MNPFAHSDEESIHSLSESELIECIREWLGQASPESPEGMGDDCSAVPLPHGKSYLLTTADPVIYLSHFDDTLSPENVASKLLKRNISDIAAMGGEARHATLSLAIPQNLSIKWLHRFFSGLSIEACNRDIQVNGGDITSTSDFLGAFLTLVGYASDRVLERKGAPPHSTLYVTGSLGGSRLKKHYAFEPRLAEGQWLASRPEISSCMDLSDGLGKDCAALLFDHSAAVIESDQVPVSGDARKLSLESGRPPLDHAINDGEDYELLFTLEPDYDPRRFESDWKQQFDTRLTSIGRIIPRIEGQPPVSFSDSDSSNIPFTGYDPFRTA